MPFAVIPDLESAGAPNQPLQTDRDPRERGSRPLNSNRQAGRTQTGVC